MKTKKVLFALTLLVLGISCKQKPSFTGGHYSFSIPDTTSGKGNVTQLSFIFSENKTCSGKMLIQVDCIEVVSTFSGMYTTQDSLLFVTVTHNSSDFLINGVSKKAEKTDTSREEGIPEKLVFTWKDSRVYNPKTPDGVPFEYMMEVSTEYFMANSKLMCFGSTVEKKLKKWGENIEHFFSRFQN